MVDTRCQEKMDQAKSMWRRYWLWQQWMWGGYVVFQTSLWSSIGWYTRHYHLSKRTRYSQCLQCPSVPVPAVIPGTAVSPQYLQWWQCPQCIQWWWWYTQWQWWLKCPQCLQWLWFLKWLDSSVSSALCLQWHGCVSSDCSISGVLSFSIDSGVSSDGSVPVTAVFPVIAVSQW